MAMSSIDSPLAATTLYSAPLGVIFMGNGHSKERMSPSRLDEHWDYMTMYSSEIEQPHQKCGRSLTLESLLDVAWNIHSSPVETYAKAVNL